jgi:hypothetical protein
MAPPAPMTTTPNSPETANLPKTTGTVSNSPRKYAAGPEYYEELRATDKQMAWSTRTRTIPNGRKLVKPGPFS